MILKNILQLYALLVCAIATIILIIFFGFFFNAATNLLIPEYKNYAVMGRYESNEAYLKFREEGVKNHSFTGPYDTPDANHKFREKRYQEAENEVLALKQLSAPELEEQRANAKKEFLEVEKRKNIQDLIYYFQWIVVAAVFYYIHWRIYKRATKVG